MKTIKAEDGTLFEDLPTNVTEKGEGEIEDEEEEEEDCDDDDGDWDWDDGAGRLTRGSAWSGGRNPQVQLYGVCCVFFKGTFYGSKIE